ncbi:Cyclic-di-AMP phosphodiesterase PgpH [Phycisphaerales bacterium]|nr:Cyclic-di-AMP phosphodiesterase PgpH [Phycisphaerales bacterium]
MSQGADNSGSRVSALAEQMRAGAGVPGAAARAVDALASPSLGLGLLVALALAVLTSVVAIVTRSQPLVAVGRVMDETRLVRREIRARDEAQTQQRREQARQATPRVYVADKAVLDRIQADLENLPKTLSAAESVEAVDAVIRDQFRLTAEILAAVKVESSDGQSSSSWIARVRALANAMTRRPFLDSQTWQRGTIEGSAPTIRLVVEGRGSTPVPRGEAVNVEDRQAMDEAAKVLARDAGFVGPLRQLVVNRLTVSARPTYTFDAAATASDQNDAAQAVEPVVVVNPVGQVIFQRGEALTESQAALFDREMEAFDAGIAGWVRWLRWASVCAVCGAVTLALSGYTLLFCPRVRRNAPRIAGVASILAGAFVIACATTAWMPQLGALTTVAPTLLVTMLITIGYDRRAALAYSLLHGLLVCVALREPVGTYGVIVAGVGAVVWSLKEIRDRNSLFRASVLTALSVAFTTAAFAIVERPVSPAVMREIGIDAALAGTGALVVGAATLFLLPLIERAFNVTTGMTLVELRDPKQPLLRELQQRAPGTYNHSLNVASIAEAAAEAIGADGLLTYVGSLYHDIGKMNKPEYFVENQLGGPNRHDKLSPAMSLLIVVGHVKDGMELAREFRLPTRLQHFIEAHHGTTLVEYFYHRARRQALSTAPKDPEGRPIEDDTYVPDEIEYRYPGPKPKTREVAILMVADAVESAARAMNEPTPNKIDQLVRGIAHKRLLDGQFEECEITLKDLNLIVESVIRTVTSMHHGRIAYPRGAEAEAPAPVRESTDTASGPVTQPGLPTKQ